MINLLFTKQPHSFNSKRETKKERYRALLKESMSRYHSNIDGFGDQDLYGIIYYFRRNRSDQDADNLSKPVWDALINVLYDDDKRVKFRSAGIFDMSESDFQTLEVTNLAPELTFDLLTALSTEDHVVYIECGKMRNDLFRFNIE
jgi:Holliday junction resolvase RusA-like endonuclease